MRIPVREPDLVGTFACPEGAGPFRSVLALGGSDGGVPEMYVRLLAPEGFAVLGLEYFGSAGTQPGLSEVPLERIERGLRWLVKQPNVAARGGRVAVVGGSKGGELALLAAATFPDLVGAVVAYTPSNVVWAGIDFMNPEAMKRSSWSFGGRPLPFVPYPAGIGPMPSPAGLCLSPIYERGLDDAAAVQAAAIPVERATGPIVIVSGGDDQMWPAERMCRLVVERMQAHRRGNDVVHLNYPKAGHVLTPYPPVQAGVPSMPMPFALGGGREHTAEAHADAWPRVLSHLR